MNILAKLQDIWRGTNHSMLICGDKELKFSDILSQKTIDLSFVNSGDVVAIVGDFDPLSINILLNLIDLKAIVVPLSEATQEQHEYFFEAAHVDYVIKNSTVVKRKKTNTHILIEKLKIEKHAGLVLFSTGTTGKPKAILHDMSVFLKRFETPRPTLITMGFLLFDHIGGINTLFHTLFNKGIVIVPQSRAIDCVIDTCGKYGVEVLPTTPTFLRLLLMSGAVPDLIPKTLKIITYGTERMDQHTLDELCELLPNIDFRQTFGMSELGIVRVKSEARNSLFMKIGGEGVETKVINDVLYIRSSSKMLGYLNADSPFDSDGWYNTKDIVVVKGEFYQIVGRDSDVINVGGLKFMSSDVEKVAINYPGVSMVQAYAKSNPITGQHVEILVEPVNEYVFDKYAMMEYLKTKLQKHMLPKRINIGKINIGHRFKKV